VFFERRRAGFKRRRRKRADFVLVVDRRRERKQKKKKKSSRVVFLFEANLFSSAGIVPVFVVCGFQGKKISIQEEQTKAEGGFYFFGL